MNLTDAVDDMSAAPGADPAFLENQVLNQMLRPGFTFESTSFGNLSQWTQLALPLSSFALETTRANEVVFQYHPPPYAELTFNSGEPEWDYLWGEDKDAAAPAVDDKRTQGDEFTLWLSDVFISSAGARALYCTYKQASVTLGSSGQNITHWHARETETPAGSRRARRYLRRQHWRQVPRTAPHHPRRPGRLPAHRPSRMVRAPPLHHHPRGT